MKIQAEDDITASVVGAAGRGSTGFAAKRTRGRRVAEIRPELPKQRLFQRPDDAIHRGYDKQTEADFARPDNFFSNYEPLTRESRAGIDRGLHRLLPVHRADAGAHSRRGRRRRRRVISSAPRNPRLVDGKPTQEPALPANAARPRPNPRESSPGGNGRALCAAACRRASPCYNPVAAVLPGRRNNPPEAAASARSRFTIRSTISNCRSCSWNSFAA